MFSFEYNHIDYFMLLQKCASVMSTKIEHGNRLRFPPKYADGFCTAIELTNGIQAMLLNLTFNQDFFINRINTDEKFFILRFDEIQVKDNITVKFGNEYFSHQNGISSTAILTGSSSDFGYTFRKGTSICGINIIITISGLENSMGADLAKKFIQTYLSFKYTNRYFEPMDAEYRRLISEIIVEEEEENPLKNIFIQNRIMLLVEKFFTKLVKKMASSEKELPFENTEMQMLMLAEATLVKDIAKPAPTISNLAKISNMSETKFKINFKKVYGASPYEYYQKAKMNQARALLISRKKTIKEVGIHFGYKNLNNFSIAFKKEFGILPSEIFN